jgi:PKD repeat protein
MKGMPKYCQLPTRYCLLLTAYCLLGCSKEEAIPITADFTIEVINSDYSVPVQVRINNNTAGAETYNWTFTGGSPSSATAQNPEIITYTEAGDYTIKLEASNQDEIFDEKEITIAIDAEIAVGFSSEIITDNFPPMEVRLLNASVGADTYHWTFSGGTPASSTAQNPENIVFNDPGEHTITLEVSNGLETYQIEETRTVAPHLVAAFEYGVTLDDDDFQAPVTPTIQNKSTSARDYNWTFTGGTPATSTDRNPTVIFNTPGVHTIALEATNGKETKSTSQSITVLPNTNLRSFEDLKLGINTAHTRNTMGAFFSPKTRQVYDSNGVAFSNGGFIDIAFFGFNQDFTLNKFVSPDEVQNFIFDAIPNATHTKFINVQEVCSCSASMTVNQFDSMTDDILLAGVTITETPAGIQEFDNSVVPRIVLFETEDGRKGAIKIKDFVVDGLNSYVLIDVKVMKEF